MCTLWCIFVMDSSSVFFAFRYFTMSWNEWHLNQDKSNGLTRLIASNLLMTSATHFRNVQMVCLEFFFFLLLLENCCLLGCKAQTLIEWLDLFLYFYLFPLIFTSVHHATPVSRKSFLCITTQLQFNFIHYNFNQTLWLFCRCLVIL